MDMVTEAGDVDKELDELLAKLGDELFDVDKLEDDFKNSKKEMATMVKEIREMNTSKNKLISEAESIDKNIRDSKNIIKKASVEKEKLEKTIELKKEELEKQKKCNEERGRIWKQLGLTMDKTGDQRFVLTFTKISVKQPEKEFKVEISTKESIVKILKVMPENTIDLSLVEELNQNSTDLRHAIVSLHRHLKAEFGSDK